MNNIFIVILNNGECYDDFENFIAGVFSKELTARDFGIRESVDPSYFMIEEWNPDVGRVEVIKYFRYEGLWYKSRNNNLNP